jgi:hypothetical protein
MLYSYIGCHLVMFLGFSFVNRGNFLLALTFKLLISEWGTSSNDSLIAVDDEETPKKPSIIETNGKPLEIQKLI